MSQSNTLDLWSCVGTSEGLLRQSAQRAQILDHDLAVWRGADGNVRAWQNRCPHRGMRLSYGFVRGDRLTCLYHGWSYDGQGSCVAIPAHPNLTPPKTIKAASYDCIERAGLIWVASQGSVNAFPDIDGEWRAARSIRIEASATDIVETIKGLSSDPLTDAGTRPSAAARTDSMPNPVGNAVRIVASDGGPSLLCAIQSVGTREAMLHISLGGADNSEPAVRRAASEWAKRLRREIEAAQPRPVAAAA